MPAITRYAYSHADFGDALLEQADLAALTQVHLPTRLARSAEPLKLSFVADPEARDTLVLDQPMRLGAQAFETGDRAATLWHLQDTAKAARLQAVTLSHGEDGPSVPLLLTELPLTPRRAYHWSTPQISTDPLAALPGGIAAGARILTVGGKRPVEDLRAGEEVWTEADGFQKLVWTGGVTVPAQGSRAPVLLRLGHLGASDDLLLDPGHGVSVEDHAFGWGLVEAGILPDYGLGQVSFGGTVTYHHLLFEAHHVIFANGVRCESLRPGVAVPGLTAPPSVTDAASLPKIASDRVAATLGG